MLFLNDYFTFAKNIYTSRALKSSMRKAQYNSKRFVLSDDEIIDVFEKEVTPHGTGAKIPCSSKYIGKKAYVLIRK